MVAGQSPPSGLPTAGYVRFAPIPAAGALELVSPTGVIDWLVSGGVDPLLIGSALHRVKATARQRSRNREASQRSRRMSAILRFRRRAAGFASLRSPSGLPAAGYVRFAPIPQVRARCSIALPPHLPPGAYQTSSVCCATSTRPVGVACGGLRFAPALCGSCPSARDFLLAFLPRVGYPSRVGFRWWFLHFHDFWYFHRGLKPHLQRAHAGHTQNAAGQPATRLESK